MKKSTRAIGKEVGKGAEAVLSLQVFSGKKAVCKHRMKKEYRCAALDESIRARRTRNEGKVMREAQSNGVNTPLMLGVDEGGKKIFFTMINGVVLEDKKTVSKKEIQECGVQLGKLHQAGIAHGDFTTSNLMSDGKNVFVIDFGLSEFTKKTEDQATDFLLFYKSVSEEKFKDFLFGYGKIAGERQTKLVLDKMRKILSRGRNA